MLHHTHLNKRVVISLFFCDYTVQLRHSQCMYTHPLWTHICKPYTYEYLQRLSRQILEIDEVTTCASLWTGTSPTTESTTPLNPIIFDPTRTTGVTEAWNHQTIYRPFCNNNFSSRICFLAIHPMTSKLYYVVLQARKRVNMFFNFCTLFNFKFSICNTPTFLCSLISPFKWHDESQPNVLCTSTKVVEDRNQVEVWWS